MCKATNKFSPEIRSRAVRLEGVDIHLVQMNALTRLRIDRNALGVWS